MGLEVHQFGCLSDNYGFLIHDPESGETATVDSPDAEAIDAALEEKQWRLTHILNTHHHFDHAGGNEALKQKWGCTVIGFGGDYDRIPGIDRKVAENDIVDFGGTKARVLEVAGHTRHVYHVLHHHPHTFVAPTSQKLDSRGCGSGLSTWYTWYTCTGTRGTPWDGLDEFSTLKNPHFDPSYIAVASKLWKLAFSVIGVRG